LVLSHGNTMTVSNASGTALGVGLYTVIQQASGSISNTPNLTPNITGAGVASDTMPSYLVSGASMYLVVARTTTTTLNSLTPSTFGQSVTFTATVAPTPSGGTVQFYDNGVALGSPVGLSGGTASYTSSTLAAGTHPITADYTGVTFFAASSSTSASQQVNAAALSVTARPQTKTYGQAVVFGPGGTNFSSSGLQNGNTITSVTLAVSGNGGAATAAVSGSPYIITPSAATGVTFTAGNYNITYNTGTLTANPATLTVTANAASQPYGAANPIFTASYANFVNGQTLGTSDVSGSPALTSANPNASAGTYVITNSIGTLTSTNYSFNLVNGTLTVTNALSTNALSSSENPALPGDPVTITAALSALAPSQAVPGGTVQFEIDGSMFGSAAALSNGVAVSGSITSLSHGYHTNEADYAGNANIAGSTNTLIELINTPPVAGVAIYSRPLNSGLTIVISNLLTNATDADGDALSLAAVGTNSNNGATISTNATSVLYSPPANKGTVPDAFSYTVADIYGATSSNTVIVTVQPPALNVTGINFSRDGAVQLNFTGTPGYTYLIQAATNLTPPIRWATVCTNTADINGMFSFTGAIATNCNACYYRAAAQ
jgi:hypothetical protein